MQKYVLTKGSWARFALTRVQVLQVKYRKVLGINSALVGFAWMLLISVSINNSLKTHAKKIKLVLMK